MHRANSRACGAALSASVGMTVASCTRDDSVVHLTLAAVHWQAALGVAVVLVIALAVGLRRMVVQLQQARQRGDESDRLFRALIERAFDAVLIISPSGKVKYASPAVERISGHPSQSVEGRSIYEFGVSGEAVAESRFLEMVAVPGQVLLRQFVHADGSVRDIEVLATNMLDEPAVQGIVMNCRDVTGTVQAQQALQKSMEELRELSRRYDAQAEQERRRISRDLHDEIGQYLTALSLDLAWLQRHADELDREQQRARLAAMERLIRDAAGSVRRVAHQLRGGMPEGLSLCDLIRSHAEEFRKRAGVVMELQVEPVRSDFPQEVTTASFRIVQEALTNVARHSNATKVRIVVREESGTLLVEVHDDGRGWEGRGVSSGLGLFGMGERALAVDGTLQVDSSPDGGVMVRLMIPL